jgi:hypothetical protein
MIFLLGIAPVKGPGSQQADLFFVMPRSAAPQTIVRETNRSGLR